MSKLVVLISILLGVNAFGEAQLSDSTCERIEYLEAKKFCSDIQCVLPTLDDFKTLKANSRLDSILKKTQCNEDSESQRTIEDRETDMVARSFWTASPVPSWGGGDQYTYSYKYDVRSMPIKDGFTNFAICLCGTN